MDPFDYSNDFDPSLVIHSQKEKEEEEKGGKGEKEVTSKDQSKSRRRVRPPPELSKAKESLEKFEMRTRSKIPENESAQKINARKSTGFCQSKLENRKSK